MRIFKFGLTGLFLLFACFMTTNAFAQADKTGFEVRAGIAVPYYIGASVGGDSSVATASALEAVGVGLDLQLMYRWTHFGLGISQLIGGVFATQDFGSISINLDELSGDVTAFQKGDGAFYGETLFMLKEYIPIGSTHLVTLAEGIGASYGAKLDHKRLYTTDTDAAFAFKLEIAYTYFIQDRYGVGLNVAYSGSLAFGDGISFSQTIVPSVVFDMVF